MISGIIRAVYWLNEYAGRIVAWVSSVLVLLICYDVFTRYIRNQTSIKIVELEWHLFALIFLIGAAYTFLHDRHVRVDVFYARYTVKGKAWLNLLGTVFFLLPLCITVLITAFDFTARAWIFGERSADPGGLANRWIIKGSLFFGFVLLGLQALAYLGYNLLILLDKPVTGLPKTNAHD